MLLRLYVDNFRCLSNFEMKPAAVAALVGPNGGGKSTVFEVLRALQGFLTRGEDAQACFPPWSRTRWDKRFVQRFELDIEESSRVFSYVLEIQHDERGGAPVVREEHLSDGDQVLYRLAKSQVDLFGDDPTPKPRTSFPFSGTRSFLPLLEPRRDNERITSFKRWFERTWMFAPSPQAMEPVSPAEAAGVFVNVSNFVSWCRKLFLEFPDLGEKIRKDLQPVVVGLSGIALPAVGPGAKTMSFNCRIGEQSFELLLNELSDGQRVLLVLYTILRAVAPQAALLVFDEPDNFVAHAEIQPWLSALREEIVTRKMGTLLVISHHPEVIDYLAPDQTLYLWRGSDGPARVRQLEFDRDKGLPASEFLKLGMADAE